MPSPPASGRASNAFLVERYVPAIAAKELSTSVARLAEICSGSEYSGSGVQYLQSAYLPEEDTCFCLFLGPSSDAVRRLNAFARFEIDRITDAVLLFSPKDGQP